jgi:hypothetical protein
MSMIGFPLLLIPLAVVNIIVFLMPGVAFTAPIVTVTLMSRTAWTVTFADALLALSLVLLLFEVLKAAKPGGKYAMDQLLALLVCAGAAAEFLLLPAFGNSVFFLLVVMCAVDFLAGVTLRLRQRKVRRAAVAARTAPVQEAPAAPPSPPVQDNVAPAAQPIPEPVAPPPLATITPAPRLHAAEPADAAVGETPR